MAENFVTVTFQFTGFGSFVDASGLTRSGAEGNYQFLAAGQLMDSPSIAIVVPVIMGQLDSTGSGSVSLLASDNFGVGELVWNVKIVVEGIGQINVTDVPVNFALGASQGLFGILEATGWQAITT